MALAAARHFYAVLIEEGDVARAREYERAFKDFTHRLQILPGCLRSWFAAYRTWLSQGAWNMPNTALWTSWTRRQAPVPGLARARRPADPGAWKVR